MNVPASNIAIDAAATWREANRRYLTNALAVVQIWLDHARSERAGAADPPDQEAALADLAAAAKAMPAPPAIDAVAAAFELSSFERDVLLLCVGVELDGAFAASCAAAQSETAAQSHPTFRLALSVLPNPHWSALSPAAPLRRFRLVEIEPGRTLTGSALRIDERVLHHIAGVPHLDERLAALVEPMRVVPAPAPSHAAIAARIVALWARASSSGSTPIVQLSGPDGDSKRAVAAAACAEIGARLYAFPAQLVGGGADELTLARLFTREAALAGSALLIDCDDLDLADVARSTVVSRLLDRTPGLLFVTTRERGRVAGRPAALFEVAKPTPAEQRALWTTALGAGGVWPAPTIELLVSQFDMGAAAIDSARLAALAEPDAEADPGRALWDACRAHARPRLDDLAQRIEVAAGWDDLVLPEVQLNMLREIAVHVRQRAKVYEAWGFASKGGRGLGVSALFAGASGTGKTMAAEVLAATLRLDLYRIDLSRVISKYIGETEKNLRRVFDAAEEAAAILLFDEADAIFGKRSEVKDSHDRYANIEVSYLLQRMEAYRGLAILTTNMKGALDTAFLRRIRFVVQFPYPDAAQRAEIWRRAFPPGTPIEGLDLQKLARLNVAGGNIRNIAINAAFLAAEAGGPVRMAEIMRAARSEYAKMERPLTRELEG
jgi:MoxR-like ATPase